MRNNLVINPFSDAVLGQCSRRCQAGEGRGEDGRFFPSHHTEQPPPSQVCGQPSLNAWAALPGHDKICNFPTFIYTPSPQLDIRWKWRGRGWPQGSPCLCRSRFSPRGNWAALSPPGMLARRNKISRSLSGSIFEFLRWQTLGKHVCFSETGFCSPATHSGKSAGFASPRVAKPHGRASPGLALGASSLLLRPRKKNQNTKTLVIYIVIVPSHNRSRLRLGTRNEFLGWKLTGGKSILFPKQKVGPSSPCSYTNDPPGPAAAAAHLRAHLQNRCLHRQKLLRFFSKRFCK